MSIRRCPRPRMPAIRMRTSTGTSSLSAERAAEQQLQQRSAAATARAPRPTIRVNESSRLETKISPVLMPAAPAPIQHHGYGMGPSGLGESPPPLLSRGRLPPTLTARPLFPQHSSDAGGGNVLLMPQQLTALQPQAVNLLGAGGQQVLVLTQPATQHATTLLGLGGQQGIALPALGGHGLTFGNFNTG